MTIRPNFVTVLATIAALPVPTVAQDWQSAYTDLDPNRCEIVERYDLAVDFACTGLAGFPVLLRHGEHRVFVSYGPDAANEIAWQQSLPSRNETGETLEWIFSGPPEEASQPVATVLRYFIDHSEIRGPDEQVLVVTKLEPGNTCHVAYIDGRRNAQANEMARQAAQELVPDWDCAGMQAQPYGTMGVTGFSEAE
jgi:hypothetical protein